MTDYALREISRVRAALPAMMKGDVRFAFVPDLHYKSIDEMRISVRNLVGAINALNADGKIEFLCLGGDNVGNYPPSKEEHIAMMRELAGLLSEADIPWLCLKGNHDDNTIHCAEAGTQICRPGNEVGDELQYEIFLSRAENYPNYHPAENHMLCGYWDVPNADTRFVFLNSSDVPYLVGADGIFKYNGQWMSAYGGAQLRWLCDTALQNAPKNVFFLEHIPFDDVRHSGSRRTNSDALDRIIQAFVRGEVLDISSDDPDFGYEFHADFGGVPHSVPARIAGHCHYDAASYDKAGFLCVTTMLAGRKASGMKAGDDGILYEREPYTEAESSMDIFTFSPSRGKLYATRYGSGADREFSLN